MVQDFRSFVEDLNEASIIDKKNTKYVPGVELSLNQSGKIAKDLIAMGFKHGDIFTISAPKKVKIIGDKDGKEFIHVTAPNKKTYELRGPKTAINGSFSPKGRASKGGGKAVSGAGWESIITTAYNELLTGNVDENILKSDKKDLATYEHNREAAMKMAKAIHSKIGSGSDLMYHFGKGKGTLNTNLPWVGDATPKTDIYIGKAPPGKAKTAKSRISLKQAGGSQLASAKKDETLSTFRAVRDVYMKENPSKEFSLLVDRVNDTFGSVISELSGNDIKVLAMNPKNIKGVVKEYLDRTKAHEEFQRNLRDFFAQSMDFKKWVVFEAMTGKVKFNNTLAASNFIVKVTSTGDTEIHKITPKYAEKFAPGVRVGVRFKSHGGQKRATSFRLDVREELQFENYLVDCLQEEISFLTENRFELTENVITRLIKKVVSKVVAFVKKVASAGLDALMKFLGLEVSSVQIDGLEI